MGNQSSSLPAELPEEFIKEVMGGKSSLGKGGKQIQVTKEQIQKIVEEAMQDDSQPAKRPSGRRSRKSRNKTVDAAAPAFARSNTTEVAPRTGRSKKTPIARSKTDSNIDSKWSNSGSKRRSAEGDIRQELDPQKVIQLLERYSDVDQQLADKFLKSLRERPDASASSSAVSKAA